MRGLVYTLLLLLVAGSIGYMVWDNRRRSTSPLVPADNFAADDLRVYNLLRADLQAFLGQDYGGWLDDQAREALDGGAAIAGQPSKTAAFVGAAIEHYPAKKRYYTALLNNLKERYE